MNNTDYNLANLWPKFAELLSGQSSITSTEGLSAFIVLILFVVFLIFGVLSFIHYLNANRKLGFYRNLLTGLTGGELLEKRRDILVQAEKHPSYGNLWREFDESLVHIPVRERLCNTLDAEHFFNTHTIARRLTENRLLAAVPGFLTALGVIGTFIGLTLGLESLRLSNSDTQSVEALQAGIFGLIGGASIAFMTSVWGIATSVLFNFYEKMLERSIRSSISSFQNRVDYLYPRVTAEQSLSNIEDFTKQSMEKLAELDEKIGHKMQEAMQQASNSIREGMEQSLNSILGPAIQKLVENAHNGSEKALESMLDRFLDGMGQAGNSQKEMMNDAAAGINAAATDMANGLAGFTTKLDTQITGMLDKNASLMAGFEDMMQRQSTSQEAHEAKRLQQFEQQIQDFQGSQSQLTDGINNILQTHESQNDRVMDRMSQLVESFQTLANSHAEATKAMQQTTVDMKSSSNQLGLLSTNLKDTTDKLSSQFVDMNDKVLQAVEENRNNLVITERLALQLENIQGSLEATASTMDKAAEKADHGLSAVDRHFNQLMTSLESHLNSLNKQVASLLDDYSNKVKDQTVDRMTTWNEQTSTYIGHMTDAVRTLSAVVDEIDGKVAATRTAGIR